MNGHTAIAGLVLVTAGYFGGIVAILSALLQRLPADRTRALAATDGFPV